MPTPHNSTLPVKTQLAITPSDTADLEQVTRGIFFGSAGNVALVFAGDATNAGVVYAVTAGSYYPWRIRRVLATGTTVTQIRGHW